MADEEAENVERRLEVVILSLFNLYFIFSICERVCVCFDRSALPQFSKYAIATFINLLFI